MPKRIVILDPNGAEVVAQEDVAEGPNDTPATRHASWLGVAMVSCNELCKALVENPSKLGTYTVTVKEVE